MPGLISVIVPVYNVSEYLTYCVHSICGQTYSNLEIILVDDGSTDGSSELCDQLAESDERILVIHQKNQGAAAARNSGLDIARGEYISIIDGDDYIWPEMYETLQLAIEQTEAQFACCLYELVEKHEIQAKENRIKKIPPIKTYKKEEIYRHLFDYHTMWVIQPNKLYCRKLYENYRFPKGHFYEDEYAAHRLLKNVERAAYIEVPFYRYYNRCGSATRRGVTSRQIFLLDALLDRIAYFQEEREAEMLPVAESYLFEAYRSVAVEMEDRTAKAKKDLKSIRKRYCKLLHDPEIIAGLSAKLKCKRYLYLMLPRTMGKLFK